MFTKGHKINLGRANPLAGRKQSPRKQIQDAIKNRDVKAIIENLIIKAKNGDREASIYIIDRIYGKPKQAIDQTVKGEILITPDIRALAAREMIETREEEAKLIENATIKEEKQGQNEGI